MLDHCTYWIMVNSAYFVKSTPTAFSVSFNTLHVCYRHIKDNVAGVYWKPCLQPNSCLNFLQQFSIHTVLYMSILNIFYQRAWARGNSWFKCKSVEEGKDQEFIQSNIIPDLSRERNSGRWLYTQSLRIGIIKTYNLSEGRLFRATIQHRQNNSDNQSKVKSIQSNTLPDYIFISKVSSL